MISSTDKNDRKTEGDTTPSAPLPGPPAVTTNVEPKTRPGLLTSVGKFMSGSVRKTEPSGKDSKTEIEVPSKDDRLATPPALPPRSDYITPEQKRFLSALNSEAEKVVRVILRSCFFNKAQTRILVTKGRIHSARKLLKMTLEDWETIMDLSDDFSLVDFRSIYLFQLWYKDQETSGLVKDDKDLIRQLEGGVLNDYFD